MNISASAAFALVPAFLAAFTPTAAYANAAKCSRYLAFPGLEPGQPVVLVDGEILEGGTEILEGGTEATGEILVRGAKATLAIEALDVHSIEILCWNPETGRFQRSSGVGVIAVLTKELAATARSSLERLLMAQAAYFSQHSAYAETRSELLAFGLSEDVLLELSATPSGWTASTLGSEVPYRCFAFSGDAAPQLEGMREGVIACEADWDNATGAIRRRYEGTS